MRRIRKDRCPECGEPHWIRYWIGENVSGSEEGICVGDFDLPIHRFKDASDNLGHRRIEHYMVVEIKTADELLGPAQRDSLSVFNAMIDQFIPVDGDPIHVKSRPGFIVKREKKVVWYGVHLLRVPPRPSPRGPFFWDNRPISRETLIDVLAFVRDTKPPYGKLDNERRHKAKPPKPQQALMEFAHHLVSP